MSSIESAPATMPATKDEIFAPALAPLSAPVFRTLIFTWARSANPADWAKGITEASPAADTRLGSSNL